MNTHVIAKAATSPYRPIIIKVAKKRVSVDNMGARKTVGYVRVSTQKQAEQGMSLDAQAAAIRAYAKMRGAELAEIVVDAGVSGKNLKRAGVQRIIDGLEAGEIGTVIVCKFDRLSRSLIDFFGLVEKYFNTSDRQLISINENFDTRSPAGALIVPMIVLFAQWERSQIAERTRTAIEHIQAQGGHHGHAPYGYDLARDGRINKLVENQTELEWLERIFKLRDSGKGLSEIAAYLNDNNIPSKRGSKWSKHTVYGVLVRRGKIIPKTYETQNLVYNKYEAWKIAYELREDQRTYDHIATELTKKGYRPLKGAKYAMHSVMDLLKNATYFDTTTAYGYAASMRQKGESLRHIGAKLTAAGFKPIRGGQWYAASVAILLRDGESVAQASIRRSVS